MCSGFVISIIVLFFFNAKVAKCFQDMQKQSANSRFWSTKSIFRSESVKTTAIGNHPITTSSTIITTKPMAKPIVLRLECCPLDASGMSSSTTTYSMAPAAKASM